MEDNQVKQLLKIISRREKRYYARHGFHSVYYNLGFLKENGSPYTVQELKDEYKDRYNYKVSYLYNASNRQFMRQQDANFYNSLMDLAEAMGDIETYNKIKNSTYADVRRMVETGEISTFETYKEQTEGYAEAYHGYYEVKNGKKHYIYTDTKGNPVQPSQRILKNVVGLNEIKAIRQAKRIQSKLNKK